MTITPDYIRLMAAMIEYANKYNLRLPIFDSLFEKNKSKVRVKYKIKRNHKGRL